MPQRSAPPEDNLDPTADPVLRAVQYGLGSGAGLGSILAGTWAIGPVEGDEDRRVLLAVVLLSIVLLGALAGSMAGALTGVLLGVVLLGVRQVGREGSRWLALVGALLAAGATAGAVHLWSLLFPGYSTVVGGLSPWTALVPAAALAAWQVRRWQGESGATRSR